MIGIINFTHSDPLYASLSDRKATVRESPAAILKDVLDGTLQAGMVSLVSLLENGLNLSMCANIHSVSTTMSTILVSNGPGVSDRMEVAVTSHTRTTEFYTEMVLKGMGIDYTLKHTGSTYADDLLDKAEYALVIGDEALKVYGSDTRILFDTGYEFSRMYHLQPLYAAMAYPAGGEEPEELKQVYNAVHPSREVKLKCAEDASQRLGLPPDLLMRYYALIQYDFPPHLLKTVEFVRKHTGMANPSENSG